MARRIRTQLYLGEEDSTYRIGEEQRYLLGPIEGAWWVRFSWFVIPLGLILLIVPWILYFNKGEGPRETPSAVIRQETSPSSGNEDVIYEYVLEPPD